MCIKNTAEYSAVFFIWILNLFNTLIIYKVGKYTLYCDDSFIESSNNLSYLIDLYTELEPRCVNDILIIDNDFDIVIYG